MTSINGGLPQSLSFPRARRKPVEDDVKPNPDPAGGTRSGEGEDGPATPSTAGSIKANAGSAYLANWNMAQITINQDFATKLDKIVSSNREETTYPDGSIKSETVTQKYASGKTVVTTKEYDESGKLSLKTTNEVKPDGTEITTVTMYYANEQPQATAKTTKNPDGSKEEISTLYNEDGTVQSETTTTTTTDKDGNVTERSVTTLPNGTEHSTTTLYYSNGNPKLKAVTTKNPDGSKIEIVTGYNEDGIEQNKTTVTTDKDGNFTKEVSKTLIGEIGITIKETRDKNGRLLGSESKKIKPDGTEHSTSTIYYANEQPYITAETTKNPDGSKEKIVTVYNEDGTLQRVTTTTTDKDGNVTESTIYYNENPIENRYDFG